MPKKKKGKKAAKSVKKAETKTTKSQQTQKAALPKKFEAMFQQILKFYENNKHPKAIKLCNTVLKAHPMHGQTIAMKGLLTYKMDTTKTAEAFELCKKGLALDMKSHVTWHVYGILYKATDNMPMAIKCYNNALKIDTENTNICRELANFQGQCRDWTGYAESRRKLLTFRPKETQNWGGYSVANHLAGKHQFALHVIDQYVDTLKLEDKRDVDATFELSEIALYRSLLYEAMGDAAAALDALGGKREGHIVDHLGWYQKKGELHLRLGQYEQALHVYTVLLETNLENYDFHRGIQCCLLKYLDGTDGGNGSKNVMPVVADRVFGKPLNDHKYWKMSGCDLPCQDVEFMTPERVALLLETYTVYRKKYPKVASFERIPLDFTTHEEYEKRMSKYLKRRLQKCVPSLYSDVKHSFSTLDGSKRTIVSTLLQSYLQSLQSTPSTFPNEDQVQDPSTYLFTLVCTAQHEDCNGHWSRSLELLNEAIQHTPTMLDLYKMKARVYKHAGDISTATLLMNKAREMDLQDRYINNKHVKYLFRNDECEKAVDTAALFTKDESGDGSYVVLVKNFYDMQVIWMEIEEGRSRLRANQLTWSVKRFQSIHDHYKQFIVDQFDFHNYCMRKSTLRAYLGMVEMVDDCHSRPEYRTASHGLVESYLKLADEALLAKNGDLNASTIIACRIKAAEKSKKKQSENKQDKEPNGKKKDFDIDGSVAVVDACEKGYMAVAFEICEDLKKFDVLGNDYKGAQLRFDVSERMNKTGPMLSSLLDCHRMQPQRWSTIANLCRLSAATPSDNAAVASLVSEQLAKAVATYNVKNVEELVVQYVATAMAVTGSTLLQCRLDAAELLCRAKLPASSWGKMAVDALQHCVDDAAGASERDSAANVRAAERAVELLSTLSSGDTDGLKKAARVRFQLASAFGAVPPEIVLVNGTLSTEPPVSEQKEGNDAEDEEKKAQ